MVNRDVGWGRYLCNNVETAFMYDEKGVYHRSYAVVDATSIQHTAGIICAYLGKPDESLFKS